HYEQARRVVDHFGGKVADRLAELPGAESLRRDLLLDSLGYYQQFLNTAADDPRLSADMAATGFKSAAIAERLGDRAAAVDHYQLAVDQWRALSEHSATAESRASLALGLSSLARVLASNGDFKRADRLFAEAIEIGRGLTSAEPDNAARAEALAETLCNFGLARRRDGDREQAADLMRQGISLYEQSLRQSPKRTQTLRSLAVAQNNLSDTLGAESLPEAFEASHAAQAAMRRLVDLHPHSPQYLADLAMTNNNQAALEGVAGNWRAAAVLYREAAKQISRLVDSNPLIPRHRRELAIAHSNLALALAKIGEMDASKNAFDAAGAVLTELAEDFPQQPLYASSLAALWNNRGVALRNAGLHEAALEAFGNSIAQQESAVADNRPSPLQVDLLRRQYENYAAALRDLNRPAEAGAAEQKLQELIADSTNQSDR
ncbi:MAG: hypothetical protein KDA37_10965, partial [Planctomycetales bacterium]|nr:hypothetical protein [Planctomycetales bacterium]